MSRKYFMCTCCGVRLRVTGSEEDICKVTAAMQYLPRKCVHDDCSGGTMVEETTLTQAHHQLTAQEFLAALAGFGLPSEIDASPEVVRAMLTAEKLVGHKVSPSHHAKRSVLEALELSNGVTLHLAGGADGATIYKITRKQHGSIDHLLQTYSENGLVRLNPDQLERPNSVGEDRGAAIGRGVGESPLSASETPRPSGGVQEESGG